MRFDIRNYFKTGKRPIQRNFLKYLLHNENFDGSCDSVEPVTTGYFSKV